MKQIFFIQARKPCHTLRLLDFLDLGFGAANYSARPSHFYQPRVYVIHESFVAVALPQEVHTYHSLLVTRNSTSIPNCADSPSSTRIPCSAFNRCYTISRCVTFRIKLVFV